MGDMWQYTEEYLSSVISTLSDYDEIKESYVEGYLSNYLEEVRGIARIIADMHIKLSYIDKEDFAKRNVEISDVEEIVKSIKIILLNF